MLRRRPEPLRGAFVVPKQRRFERMDLIERLPQPAASAICEAESVPETIMSWIIACCDSARFGAMLWAKWHRVMLITILGEEKCQVHLGVYSSHVIDNVKINSYTKLWNKTS
jgi:hypothetical protein